jgi:8-oxo-dGTP pyrophosphatase MutT (NUDIX family)
MHHDTVSDTAYTPTQPPAPPRDASTVVVLRDGAGRARGPEVYLVKRSRMVDFMAGAHVFPGGRLDRDDSSPSALALLSAEVAALHARLGEALPAVQAAGLYVAAIRETFEEAASRPGGAARTRGTPWRAARSSRRWSIGSTPRPSFPGCDG